MPIAKLKDFEHLPNAPITEAVMEIRVHPIEDWDHKSTGKTMQDSLKDYPTSEEIRLLEGQLNVSGDPNTEPTTNLSYTDNFGVRLKSRDSLNIVILKSDRFSFSRLAPYESWDQFFANGWTAWNQFRDNLKPTNVVRLGIRFLNRLPLPLDGLDLSEYLRAPPLSYLGNADPLTGFLHQQNHRVSNTPYSYSLVKTTQEAIMSKRILPIILDVDVYCSGEFEPETNQIKERLIEMRNLKNEIFFANLTEKCLDLFREPSKNQ